ncbi:MAG: glycosyltransferase family 4 protein [Gemmatimonadales bacterium]
MRVLMFGWEFPPHQAGGLATATVGLVKGLVGNGTDVVLTVPFPVDVNPVPGLRLLGAPGEPSVATHRVASPLEPYASAERYQEVFRRTVAAQPGNRAVYGRDLFAEVDRFAAAARQLASRERHDVIDAHDWITFPAGIAARAVSGRPFVAHLHATEYDRTGGPGNPAIREREGAGLLAADRVICNSRRLAEQCVQLFGVDPARVDVVHWGIDAAPAPDAADPTPPGRGPVVLFLGRVTSQKGPDYFIEMAARVVPLVPDCRFVVAGGGDMLPGLMEQVAALGLTHRVRFAGGLAGPEVTRAFRSADVCVMPSRSEPFGLVALESLLAGTPCIMPRQAGVAEVVRNAFKVDHWDVDDIANKVVALLRHRVLRQELSARGREELALPRFGLAEPARLTETSYRRALAGARRLHA